MDGHFKVYSEARRFIFSDCKTIYCLLHEKTQEQFHNCLNTLSYNYLDRQSKIYFKVAQLNAHHKKENENRNMPIQYIEERTPRALL